MSLPLASILPLHTYTRTHKRKGTLSRRVLLLGTQAETSHPLCIRPSSNTEDWVRYETWIGGMRFERSCTRGSFARWAEADTTPTEQYPKQTKIAV